MKKLLFDAFVSYSHKDKAFVSKLVAGLRAAGLRVFIDYEQFDLGKPVIMEIERGIKLSKHILIVMSPSYFRSYWNESEYLFLQMHDPTGTERKILPILYRECRIPPLLSVLTYMDFRKDFDKGMAVPVSALKHTPSPLPRVVAKRKLSTEGQTLQEVLKLNKQILSMITANPSQTLRQKNNIFFNSNVTEDPSLCFVLMPFGPKWSRLLFEKHITAACAREGFNALRADDIHDVSGIMQQVWLYINQARLIIADLTTRNPNVFYEVGLAHALGKDVILTTQTMDDVTFDLGGIRCVVYSLELDGPQKFEEDLQLTIKELVKQTTKTS